MVIVRGNSAQNKIQDLEEDFGSNQNDKLNREDTVTCQPHQVQTYKDNHRSSMFIQQLQKRQVDKSYNHLSSYFLIRLQLFMVTFWVSLTRL